MTRNPDILFITEYIKNVLYFATVRQGRHLKSTADTHYFCIDNQLIYENYYSDFGPLNIGCVYKYCKLLNDKIKELLNKQVIVHYTSIDPKKKANAAFLLGCYGVLYLSLTPKDALKPLVIHGQNYRPFQDATQGDSCYTISLIDCLQALLKARDLGFFNFQDFNYEEYDRLDKIQGGDLNWLIPGKYLAFIGPVDYSVSLYHPPEMYVSYFLENNVRIVIRLNKKLYDGNVKRIYDDINKLPTHEYGIYSIVEKIHRQKPVVFNKSPSPPPPIQRSAAQSDSSSSTRPHASKTRDEKNENDDEEVFITSCDLTIRPTRPQTQLKGCVISTIWENEDDTESGIKRSCWKKYLCCEPCTKALNDGLWMLAVRCTKIAPKWCSSNKCCNLFDMTFNKISFRDTAGSRMRRGSGAGEPRGSRPLTRANTPKFQEKTSTKTIDSNKNTTTYGPLPTFRTSEGPIFKNVADAKNFLMRSSLFNEQKSKHLASTITVTPQYSYKFSKLENEKLGFSHLRKPSPPPAPNATKFSTPFRRQLGRSPSPSPTRHATEQSRATNTPTPSTTDKFMARDSKVALREALSRLKCK
ncbi:unnamed protein product [Pieris brassicae]|uniref:Dual specificity/tyrosine protein phosphatase N-terminal domain-containing protein n=1 Tax=Pieris brassicae TaxID=7116 RepID=A0A9P0X2R0_PIEBR|nr:unnamed protein product [Pieris brassicae]